MHLNTEQPWAGATILTIENLFEPDQPDDLIVVTTRRAISRVAHIASETAARFEREGVPHEPMAWLCAPRRLFCGASAIDACLNRDEYQRAIVMHGLSLGLDATPGDIDALMEDDELPVLADQKAEPVADEGGEEPPKLFSATIDYQTDRTVRRGFHASMASSSKEFRARLLEIFGSEAMRCASVREGFNPSTPIIADLVAPDIRDDLMAVAQGTGAGRGVAYTTERVVDL